MKKKSWYSPLTQFLLSPKVQIPATSARDADLELRRAAYRCWGERHTLRCPLTPWWCLRVGIRATAVVATEAESFRLFELRMPDGFQIGWLIRRSLSDHTVEELRYSIHAWNPLRPYNPKALLAQVRLPMRGNLFPNASHPYCTTEFEIQRVRQDYI
jgi:hypothetical protein